MDTARDVNKLDLAERILHLSELCRKQETENEKVLPFSTIEELEASAAAATAQAEAEGALAKPAQEGPQPGEIAEEKSSSAQMSSYGVDAEGNKVPEWDYLNQFFKRFNRVQIDNAAIGKEKMKLEASNRDLRNILKQYLDGISVNKDVMDDPTNPLFVVNDKVHSRLRGQTEEEQLKEQQLELVQQFV